MTQLSLIPTCMGLCGKPSNSPFCPDCLADIARWSATDDVEVYVPVGEHYMVSSFGQVRSVARTVVHRQGDGRVRKLKGKLLKQHPKGKGYPAVVLCGHGESHQRKVHHLVLEAFLGPRPAGMLGLHRNDIKTDNRLANLYWGTDSDNAADAYRNGKPLSGWAAAAKARAKKI